MIWMSGSMITPIFGIIHPKKSISHLYFQCILTLTPEPEFSETWDMQWHIGNKTNLKKNLRKKTMTKFIKHFKKSFWGVILDPFCLIWDKQNFSEKSALTSFFSRYYCAKFWNWWAHFKLVADTKTDSQAG